MHDDREDCEDQQQVDKESSSLKEQETTDPKYEQHNRKDEKHLLTPLMKIREANVPDMLSRQKVKAHPKARLSEIKFV
jgi:hypothetical protein